MSDLSSIALIYHFTNNHTGDFGGIYFDDYNTNNNSANQVRSNFTDLSSRQYKTDYILTHSKISQDTTFIINSNLFLNHLENNVLFKNEKTLLTLDSTGKNISSAINYGANTNIKYNLSKIIIINSGAEISSDIVPNTLFTAEYKGVGYYIFGNAMLNLQPINIAFGGRYGTKYGEKIFALGTNITNKLTNELA
jgi:hypothetical protein